MFALRTGSVLLAVLLTICFTAIECRKNWPASSYLERFWPFDQESGTKNVNKLFFQELHWVYGGKLVTWMAGPFGKLNTSYSVDRDPSSIGAEYDLPLKSSFTFSCYYYSRLEHYGKRGGIFQMTPNHKAELGPLVAINSGRPNRLEVWSGPGEGKLVADLYILAKEQWNFVAITYTAATKKLIVYHQTGTAKMTAATTENVVFPTFAHTTLEIGGASWGRRNAIMETSDAMACVMYYTTALSQEEVQQLPHVCETKGRD